MRITLSSFLQWKLNMIIYKMLSWKITFFYIKILCRIYFMIFKEERRKISMSVQSLFSQNKGTSELKDMMRGIFDGITAHYYEKMFNAYENLPGLHSFFNECINASSLNKIDNALKKGRGGLFVTAHYGGIEYIPFFLALKGDPVSAIVKFSSKGLKDTICLRATEVGLRIVDPSQKNQTLKRVIRELRANRIVFTECDEIEEWKPSRIQKMAFLRRIIGVDRTINIILKRTGAEVIFGLLHRIRLNQYTFIIEGYQDMIDHFGRKPFSVGEVLLKMIEQYIYICPEGWHQWKNYSEIGTESEAVEQMEVIPSITPLRTAMC